MKALISLLCLSISVTLCGQQVPDDRVLKINELARLLKPEIKARIFEGDQVANSELAAYFREKLAERFFYDHKSFYTRLSHYHQLYQNQEDHKSRALDHMGKYADSTTWILPFDYLNGQAVNAYALRHLARQHKMVDIALLYFSDRKDPRYIKYFENQMRSLNVALESDQYERIADGNGVYEVFRSGYRVLNWLWIHNMILNEPEYSDKDQLTTIATLLQHGQHLYERNQQFRSGNHQTRGMSALALLAILLRDFAGTELWYQRAMLRLSEHLNKEINPDGFQFERSVHYHMSDINNYYYVYQLAKINNIEVEKEWEEKLRNLFVTLVKVAYPDRSAPVLQDDTEIPWAEKNDISGAMTLGYLLFEDPEFGYFASDKVDERMYWFLSNSQVELLENISQKQPAYGSLGFKDTHYYIMREGWGINDKMLIVSAGLDSEKPDHQHGDMLGIQAMSNCQVILPNYQVRYSLKDFDFFKNSMVKNVALVDQDLQGKQWTSNKGGSGFGKFKELPNPRVITWATNESFDLFVGSHDGFENIGVAYSRQVVFVKDDFWIVKDNFSSAQNHDYKQVWQGHYTKENGPNLIRAVFPDASGVDILQLNLIDTATSSGTRGKHWTVLTKTDQEDFSFITLIFPYRGYSHRINELEHQIRLDDWEVNASPWKILGEEPISIGKDNRGYLFGVRALEMENLNIEMSSATDLYLEQQHNKVQIHMLGTEKKILTVHRGKEEDRKVLTRELNPGDYFELYF